MDFKLQPLTAHVPSYVKNSLEVIRNLKKQHSWPTGAKLFTSDAVSMYTNIDPNEGIDTIQKYLTRYSSELHEELDMPLILELLNLVMRHCIFQFEDTWWIQRICTAMGTPYTCIYAILFFAYFERTYILRKYSSNILFYKRQIDDIFGVWVDDPSRPNAYAEFKNDLNVQSKLKWKTSDLSTSVDFLDLTIMIDTNGI